MRYAAIKDYDIKQAPGINVSLWSQGCSHRCRGCHNSETWDFNGGKEFTEHEFNMIIKMVTEDRISKNLSVLGGEPFEKENLNILEELFKRIRDIQPSTKIWVWTGYLYEYIKTMSIIEYVDVLVDGKYIEELKHFNRYTGSSNQRIIDVKESLKNNKLILL